MSADAYKSVVVCDLQLLKTAMNVTPIIEIPIRKIKIYNRDIKDFKLGGKDESFNTSKSKATSSSLNAFGV